MESHLLLLSDGLIQGMCFTIFVHVLTFGFCNCNLQTTVLQSLSPHFAVVPGVPHPPAVPQCVGGTPPPQWHVLYLTWSQRFHLQRPQSFPSPPHLSKMCFETRSLKS